MNFFQKLASATKKFEEESKKLSGPTESKEEQKQQSQPAQAQPQSFGLLKPDLKQEMAGIEDDYGGGYSSEGAGDFNPQDMLGGPQEQEAASASFPHDDALILHYVDKYGQEIEDLEESIKFILFKYESLATKSDADKTKSAKKFDMDLSLLQEILDAKKLMIESGAKKEKPKPTSIFDKNESGKMQYKFLKTVLADDYPIETEKQLEDLIRQKDETLRYHIVRNMAKQNIQQFKIEHLESFARNNNLPKKYFQPNSLAEYPVAKIDDALQLFYQGKKLEFISNQTGIDMLNLEQLWNLEEIYKNKGADDGRSCLRYVRDDFVSLTAAELYHQLYTDSTSSIDNFNQVLGLREGGAKSPLIQLKEFRSVNLLKKSHLADPISNCSTFSELFVIIKPLIITYIQGSLPLQEIIDFISARFQPAKSRNIKLTAQDLFDMLLLQSDEDVKALILERYSIIYPVPLLITQYQKQKYEFLYHMAYFMKPCKTVLSFGILKASWSKCGKSALLDEIFSTDFTFSHRGTFDARLANRGQHSMNQVRNKYDKGRMDIQMPRNIDPVKEATQWQIIDASRLVDPNIIDFFCWKVNVLIIHIFASEFESMGMGKLKQLMTEYMQYHKRLVVFIRDIDRIDEEQQNTVDVRIAAIQALSENIYPVKMQSILMREYNAMNEFHRTQGQSYEYALNQACRVIKQHVINYNVNLKQQFNSTHMIHLYRQIHSIPLSGEGNILYNDIGLVQEVIDGVSKELEKQLDDLQQKYKDKLEREKSQNVLERYANDDDGENLLAAKVAKDMLQQSDNMEDQIASSMISDRVLFYFSKYVKYQKYQGQVNLIINDNDFQTEFQRQASDKLTKNALKGEFIKDRSLKMRKIFDEMLPFQKFVAMDIFLRQILRNPRSVLLVWVMAEKLHHESAQNPLWKRFLMNQEIFDNNIHSETQKISPNLDEIEMLQILNKKSYDVLEGSEYQLSIFDFFREIILAYYYSKHRVTEIQTSLAYISSKPHLTIEQKMEQSQLQQAQTSSLIFMQDLKTGFERYIESGESVELIDGEYLRIHDAELTELMQGYLNRLKQKNRNEDVQLIVVSQIGRQSVGKSFLFNHMFKTKFLNRSGRCTQGVNMAMRDLDCDLANREKLLILDTEGLGSLDKARRLIGKDVNFDRCMVLFCLTVSNALMITLKNEIDTETSELLSVCCWALQNLKINKQSMPQVYFVLNQQAETSKDNYIRQLNELIRQITDNEMTKGGNIGDYLKITAENFVILPSAFNQEKRNFENLYIDQNFTAQRSIVKSNFTEQCQNLASDIIRNIKSDHKNKLQNFKDFMRMAGDAFRTITSFPELLRFKNISQLMCNKNLREKVFKLIDDNQIITNEYYKINQALIQKIHLLELSRISMNHQFKSELLQPLEDCYQTNYDNLRAQFDQYSQHQEYNNYPDIKQFNKQILSNQCFKQYQFFKNIIEDQINHRYKRKLQQELEDKVSKIFRSKSESLVTQDEPKWQQEFDKVWNEQSKVIFKDEDLKDPNNIENFRLLFEDHYTLFKLDLMDSHRIIKDQIYQRYIQPFFNIGDEEQKQHLPSFPASPNKRRVVKEKPNPIERQENRDLIIQIIDYIKKDIKAIFKGQQTQVEDANDNLLNFFEADIKRPPAGKIRDIQGKNQAKPRYISIDSISQYQYMDQQREEHKQFNQPAYIGQTHFPSGGQPKNHQSRGRGMRIPSDNVSPQSHQLIKKLLGQKDDQIIFDQNQSMQACELAMSLKCIDNKKLSVWDRLVEELDGNIRKSIEDKSRDFETNLQGYLNKKNSDQSEEQKGPQAMDIIDSIGANVMQNQDNMIRSLDSNNIRLSVNEVQKSIQEIDYELGYIWVSLSSRARMYLNTLAFFYCLEARINRDEFKKQNELQIREMNKQNYYEKFLQMLKQKQREKSEGLTDEVMQNYDKYRASLIFQNLMNKIVYESQNFTSNQIQTEIQENNLSNRTLVQQINSKVYKRVFRQGEEAKDNEDVGVQYIVNYHGLIDQAFTDNWARIEEDAYNTANRRYKDEIDQQLKQILNAFKALLQEMRSLLRNYNKTEAEINEGKISVVDCFKTNELFELYLDFRSDRDDSSSSFSKIHMPSMSLMNRSGVDGLGDLSGSFSAKHNDDSFTGDRLISTEPASQSFRAQSRNQNFDLTNFEQMEDHDRTISEIELGNNSDNESERFDPFSEQDQSNEIKNNKSFDNQQFEHKKKLTMDTYRIPILYLSWLFSQKHQDEFPVQQKILTTGDMVEQIQIIRYRGESFKFKKDYTFPFVGTAKDTSNIGLPKISDLNLEKLKQAGLFDNYEIYNLYRFISEIIEQLDMARQDISLRTEDFKLMIQPLRLNLKNQSKGCQERCPACNKFCEEAFNHSAQGGLSPHSCSQYGHQFFSMGGRIWSEKNNDCILVQCHDKRLKGHQSIRRVTGKKETWEGFKNRNNEWQWDDGVLGEEKYGQDFMIQLHNMCGRQAFKYYKSIDPLVDIRYRKYTDEDAFSMRGLQKGKQICFVIDGTYSMWEDIKKVTKAVETLTKKQFYKEVAIVVYRDHDYQNLMDIFPSNGGFSTHMNEVKAFLGKISTNIKGSSPNEAALDGLAAACSLPWGNHNEKDLILIHIFDAQPHGDWPNYKDHHEQSGPKHPSDKCHCCCCSPKCDKAWERDVFTPIKAMRIQYHSIFTKDKDYVKGIIMSHKRYNEGFEAVMKDNLGKDLCPDTSFQITNKDLVEIKINDIIIKDRENIGEEQKENTLYLDEDYINPSNNSASYSQVIDDLYSDEEDQILTNQYRQQTSPQSRSDSPNDQASFY